MSCKAKCWKIGVLVVVGVAALGWVVMLLWNWLLPELFGIHPISYVQAIGVLLLSKILFGGLRGHCAHGHWHRQRMERMAPEERDKFLAGMRGCCGSSKAGKEGLE